MMGGRARDVDQNAEEISLKPSTKHRGKRSQTITILQHSFVGWVPLAHPRAGPQRKGYGLGWAKMEKASKK